MGPLKWSLMAVAAVCMALVLIACLIAIPRSATGKCYKNGCCETRTQSDIDCE